ncbi:hypothetical protein [Amycolatopsis sp. MJM2582]|uniref:hypothetical protein n=1 Tax=Amycolatopsis sp. MJM2582 TaxID=1427749 RepID=UPI00126A0486|nr:hypothetical protein [Amycolatopsis sp. MJM2582]
MLDEQTVLAHTRAWHELAAIREVNADYATGHDLLLSGIDDLRSVPGVPGVPDSRVGTVLQQAMLFRVQGELDRPVRTVREGYFAKANDLGKFLQGLVALREGGLEVVLGRGAPAFHAYRRAKQYFTGLSHNKRENRTGSSDHVPTCDQRTVEWHGAEQVWHRPAVGAILSGADIRRGGHRVYWQHRICRGRGPSPVDAAQRSSAVQGVAINAAGRAANHPELGPFGWVGLCIIGMGTKRVGGAFIGMTKG